LLPTLDEQQLEILRRVGREWDEVLADPDAWRRALPIDPNLDGDRQAAEIRPTRFWRFVPVDGQNGRVPASGR
jgi:hypothetical protein